MATCDSAQMEGKANFDDIYTRPDPRAYYRELGALDYEIPAHGQELFRHTLGAFPVERPTVVDLCCSYGVNAALLRCDLTLDDLYAHYRADVVADLSRAELVARDRDFYRRHHRKPDAPLVVGLDAAAGPVEYALEVGLLDDGVAADLERDRLDPDLAGLFEGADAVTVTGGIGYITERTIAQVIDAAGGAPDPPAVAALCLRIVDYGPIAEALADRGLVTERLEGRTFRQRTFAEAAERRYAETELARHGLELVEDDGYHADFFLSRPAEQVRDLPLEELFAAATSASR